MKEVPFTQEEFEKITQELNKNLGPEWLCTRSGPSGRVTYIEGKTAIGIANDIFGFNGWNSEIKETTIDFVSQKNTYLKTESKNVCIGRCRREW